MSQRRNKRRRSLRRRSAKRGFARHYDQGGYQRSLFHELLEDRRLLAGVHPFDLATLDGNNGFRLDGIDLSDASGFSVSTAGDVNGDGFDDMLVGAHFDPQRHPSSLTSSPLAKTVGSVERLAVAPNCADPRFCFLWIVRFGVTK